MFTLEAPSQYRCQCCASVLQTAPEYECSEWFLRCVSCGAKNLFVLTLRFIGWRPAESDLDHSKAGAHSAGFDQPLSIRQCFPSI